MNYSISGSKDRCKTVICHGEPIIGFLFGSYALRIILKGTINAMVSDHKFRKLFSQLQECEHMQKHRLNSMDNLAGTHKCINTAYPIQGVKHVTRDVNEAIRMFLKATRRLEGTGSVHVPGDDPINRNYRQKLPYYLARTSNQNGELRFRHPKELDCSHLVQYNRRGEIIGIKDHAPASIFKPGQVLPDSHGNVHLTPLEKLFICSKTNINPPPDLVHVFSLNHHYGIFDGSKIPHEGKHWDRISKVNHHKSTQEAIKYLDSAITKAKEVLARHPNDPQTHILKRFVNRFDRHGGQTTRDQVTKFFQYEGDGFHRTDFRAEPHANARLTNKVRDRGAHNATPTTHRHRRMNIFDPTHNAEVHNAHEGPRRSISVIGNPRGARHQTRIFHPNERNTVWSQNGSQPHSRLVPLQAAAKNAIAPPGHPEHGRTYNTIKTSDVAFEKIRQTRGMIQQTVNNAQNHGQQNQQQNQRLGHHQARQIPLPNGVVPHDPIVQAVQALMPPQPGTSCTIYFYINNYYAIL